MLQLGENTHACATVWVGAATLSGGYFVLGLTNATIGILPQTALFGVGLGALMAIAIRGSTHA